MPCTRRRSGLKRWAWPASLAFAFLTWGAARGASTAAGPIDPPNRSLSRAQLKQDLEILRETFEKAHAGLYRYSPKAAMDSAFDAVASQIASSHAPTNEVGFYRLLTPLIDLIHDSHTSLTLTRATRWDFVKRALAFPLNVRYVGSRPFVERNVSANSTIPLRGEILSINGHRMADITPTMLAGRTTDGAIQAAKYHALDRNFWFFYRALVDTSETFRIEIREPDSGHRRTYEARGVPADSVAGEHFTTGTHDTLTLVFFRGGRIALLSIPTLADTALALKIPAAFAEIERHHAGDLIIDLRDDSGGRDEYNTALLDHLVDHPYRFYRGFTYVVRDTLALRFTEHRPVDFMGDEDLWHKTPVEWERAYREHSLPELLDRVNATNLAAGIHRPAAHRFAGRLYVLVNGGSASSGAEVPSLLHFQGVGTLVGESPNGAYQGVTAGILLKLTLPNSGIRTIVPLIAYHNAVLPGILDGLAVPVDFEVPQSLEDAISGKDTALEFTLRLIDARSSRDAGD